MHPPTNKYNYKLRQGRGFTLAELKDAGVCTELIIPPLSDVEMKACIISAFASLAAFCATLMLLSWSDRKSVV